MNTTKSLDDLAQIRSIMERSKKFLSLSPWAAILAGFYALVGAGLAYREIYRSPVVLYEQLERGLTNPSFDTLWGIAIGVFLFAGFTALWVSYRKAQRAGETLWSKPAIRLAVNFAIPMLAGGAFVILLFLRGYYDLLAASTLLFYGFALLNAGNFTFSDIRNLGMSEMLVGIAALFFPGKGLFFWALGFGVLHIVYGILMYWKYERKAA